MKKNLLFIILPLLEYAGYGQVMSVDNMLTLTSFTTSKFDNYLSRNGFAFAGNEVQQDTVLRMYDYRQTRHFKATDSISRSITRATLKDDCMITYETASFTEFRNMKAALKNAGFYCNRREGPDTLAGLLYQNKDLSVRTLIKATDGINRYSLQFHKKTFPRAKDIYYANDLLTFTSHEYLAFYFGGKNVRKDTYFLSENEISKCSVLFLNTNRQVVFIWKDEENQCTIARLLLGGQQNLKSSIESGKYVQENNWVLKSGLRPGMSLEELRLLNGTDFRFYGGNSGNSGAVIPDNAGKLDFRNEEIILSCLNCNDDQFTTSKLVTADASIRAGRILFILSIILHP